MARSGALGGPVGVTGVVDEQRRGERRGAGVHHGDDRPRRRPSGSAITQRRGQARATRARWRHPGSTTTTATTRASRPRPARVSPSASRAIDRDRVPLIGRDERADVDGRDRVRRDVDLLRGERLVAVEDDVHLDGGRRGAEVGDRDAPIAPSCGRAVREVPLAARATARRATPRCPGARPRRRDAVPSKICVRSATTRPVRACTCDGDRSLARHEVAGPGS